VADILTLVGGLALLIIGGELLVRGAVEVAERLGMSPLLIGLTLVGFGTSTPELVTSVQASLIGSPGIAVGNIVGSNISNTLLILGLSALIMPMAVSSTALRRDGIVVLLVSLMFAIVSYMHILDRISGGIFVGLLIAYIAYAYRQERSSAEIGDGHTAAYTKAEAHDELLDGRARSKLDGRLGFLLPLGMALAGLAIIIFGGKLLVEGAVAIARSYGVSESVIGLTIVAVGTSMPELVTSLVAAFRRHGDVAIGNILGSNIYNILGIGGATGLIAPTIVPPDIVAFDNLVMLAATIVMFAFAWSSRRISRVEGLLMFAGYVAYIAYLWPK
jgi:cation:H+ antiporter